MGFVGAAAVVLAFVAVVTAGFRVAAHAPDAFGRYLAVGLITLIGLSAAVNLCVVTGLIPTTGIPLPFLSYGGRSLVVNFAPVGILGSIGRHAGKETAFGYARQELEPIALHSTFVDYV